MIGWLLVIAFVTTGGNSGVSISSAGPYADRPACEAAGRAAKSAIEGWGSSVRFSCSPQSSAPQAAVPAR